jgi:hypothetical protein
VVNSRVRWRVRWRVGTAVAGLLGLVVAGWQRLPWPLCVAAAVAGAQVAAFAGQAALARRGEAVLARTPAGPRDVPWYLIYALVQLAATAGVVARRPLAHFALSALEAVYVVGGLQVSGRDRARGLIGAGAALVCLVVLLSPAGRAEFYPG